MKRVRLIRTGLLLGILSLASAVLQAQRPSTIQLVPGSVELRNVVYTPGTPADISKPAAGTADLALIFGSATFTKPGVTFTNLITSNNGALSGVRFTLDRPFEFTPGLGVKITLPTGDADVFADKSISLVGKAIITTPFRLTNGDPIEAEVSKFTYSGNQQSGSLKLNGVGFKGPVAGEGIQLPSLRVLAPKADIEVSWAAQGVNAWKLLLPTGTLEAGIPGVATVPKYPLAAAFTELSIDQDGKVNCPEFSISNRSTIDFPDIAGFKATVAGGTLTVKDSKPKITNLRVDVTLPPAIQADDTDSNPNPGSNNPPAQPPNGEPRRPVRIPSSPRVIVKVENGLTIEFPDPIAFKVGKTKLTASRLFIDLSTSLFGAGAPVIAAEPKWKGVWLPSGTVTPALGTATPKLAYTNFLIEPNGLSGTASASNLSFKFEGFDLNKASVSLTFAQNQLTAGQFGADITVPRLGVLPCTAEFNEDGEARVAIQNGQLEFHDLGLKLERVNAQLDQKSLQIGGDLTFKQEFVTRNQMPQELAGTKLSIQGLKVAGDGSITLPSEGGITLGTPARVNVGPCIVELRGLSFTAPNNEIESVTFSGSAFLTKPLEGLPAAGELDFEGMRVSKRRGDPPFSMGGFGFKAEIPELGTISASLFRTEIESFGDTLYGDAELKLTCLGSMASGIGLEFLLAPKGGNEPAAWFIGGNVLVPPIPVQAPGTPPVPLFNINGFSGGFGLNVALVKPGTGRISEPNKELKYSKGALVQIGLLLSDPASSGRVWWADTALTFTLNPVLIDLTARMTFLDLDGADFIDRDEWLRKDRIATVFMALNLSKPEFIVGGDADLNFPTRATSLISMSGSAELLIGKTDKHLYIGWPEGGQKPVNVRFAEAFKGVIELKGSFGMGLDFANKSGGVFLDADARFVVAGVGVTGGLLATLDFKNFGEENWSISGQTALSAQADFGFFTAQVDASLLMQINKDIRITGEVSGRAGPFEGSFEVDLVVPAKK
jgi:hypothetical protein